MNKFIIDFDLLSKNDLDLDELIVLLRLYNNESLKPSNEDYVGILERKLFIKIVDIDNSIKYILREKAKLLIESLKVEDKDIYREKSENVKSITSFEQFVKNYRNLWNGLKPGAMGSKADCENKMRKWMINNPEYSQDDIMKAARSYINSVNDLRFLQQADYFIYKKDKYTESSRLSALIDEDEIIEDGWSSDIK